MSATITGRISVHPRGFGFLLIDEPGEASAFISPPDLNPFLDGDIASAVLVTAGDGRTQATALKLLSRSRTELFGTVSRRGKRPFLRVDRLVANTDWPFQEGAAADLHEGESVVAQIQGDCVIPIRTVAESADLGLERCMARHGLRQAFPPELADFARDAARIPALGGRIDLRELPTVTIDSPVTMDIDDALSVHPAGPDGTLRALISIADVSAFVPEGSPLDGEARARGTSVYLAGRVLPMFPDALSSEAASLVQDNDRPALTVELRIDDEGQVTSVDIYESLIRSHGRLTYEGVAEFLCSGQSHRIPARLYPTLRWLRTAAARLSAVRAARGGLELAREETSVILDEITREPAGVVSRRDTEAHRIVERLMVAANEAVARWLFERGLPGLYRVHDEPAADRVKALAGFARNFGIEAGFGPTLSPRGLAAFEAQLCETAVGPAVRTVLGRALGPARYSAQPGSHFGLAAPLYLHFTSPIRRYADLTVHRIVKQYLRGQRDFEETGSHLEPLAHWLNRQALAATKAENERRRMLVARLFASRTGERSSGNIVSVKPFGLVVQMKGTGVTGTIAMEALPGSPYRLDPAAHALVGPSRRYGIGDAVDVKVEAVHEELGRIELTLAD